MRAEGGWDSFFARLTIKGHRVIVWVNIGLVVRPDPVITDTKRL
jgi:hypothetical protein